ncbi:hypothetical protein [Salinispora oceanensis]|uniref:hypothetical protein n=1 Tax=Salinispora oceanensis TaxID=1050199 RepID=UPI001CC7B3E8|nr:hypothetical protein [Salinispora oceanensis]
MFGNAASCSRLPSGLNPTALDDHAASLQRRLDAVRAAQPVFGQHLNRRHRRPGRKESPVNRSGTIPMWILVMGLASLVAALVTAMLKNSLDAPVAEAVLSAGMAFGCTFGLGLGILGALQQPRSRSTHRGSR